MYYSGRDGSLYADGAKVARVANWALSSTAEALETTDLGKDCRTYRYGLKSMSGSCNVWYHDNDPEALLSKIVKVGAASDSDIVRLSLRWGPKKIDVDALITNASLTCQVGAVMQAAISFSVTGDFQEVEF